MSFLTEYPVFWFRLLFKPESAVEDLRIKKPGVKEGAISIAYTGFIIGFIAFALSSLISVFTILSGDLMTALISILVSGAMFLIGIPVLMVIALLISTVFLRVASIVFKGNASFAEECGVLGVLGSCYTILYVLMYAVMGVMALIITLLSSAIGIAAGNFSLSFIFMMAGIGLIFIPLMPLVMMLMATTFTVLAGVEGVNIYRSGLIIGLMYGLGTFVFMLLYGSILFIFMQSIFPMAPQQLYM